MATSRVKKGFVRFDTRFERQRHTFNLQIRNKKLDKHSYYVTVQMLHNEWVKVYLSSEEHTALLKELTKVPRWVWSYYKFLPKLSEVFNILGAEGIHKFWVRKQTPWPWEESEDLHYSALIILEKKY